MPTFTALTTLPGKAQAETLGAALERMQPEPTGIGVFEMEDGSALWEVGAYFTAPPDEAALALLAAAFQAKPFVVSELPETDWVAQVPAEAEPLLIEAAMAFGTGHHGTTLGCLLALDALIDQGFVPKSVADIGCGTAVLAMAAARIWQARIIASDIDPVAVEVAQANLRANGLGDQVMCVEAAGMGHPDLADAAPFDLIFANILKGPLIALAPDLFRTTAPGGFAILSGILNEQADQVIESYEAIGYNLSNRSSIVDWTTLVFQKMA